MQTLLWLLVLLPFYICSLVMEYTIIINQQSLKMGLRDLGAETAVKNYNAKSIHISTKVHENLLRSVEFVLFWFGFGLFFPVNLST